MQKHGASPKENNIKPETILHLAY